MFGLGKSDQRLSSYNLSVIITVKFISPFDFELLKIELYVLSKGALNAADDNIQEETRVVHESNLLWFSIEVGHVELVEEILNHVPGIVQ